MLLSLSYLYSTSYSRLYIVRHDLRTTSSPEQSSKCLFAEEYINNLADAVRRNTLQEFRDSLLTPDVLMLDGIDVELDSKEAAQKELYYLLRTRHELHKYTYLFAYSSPAVLSEHSFLPALVSLIQDGQVECLDDECGREIGERPL